jgi:glutathione S-transferase
MTNRLISFQISHYCEKARWALDRLEIPYVEECHLPPLHRLRTIPLGGSSVPLLITATTILKDSVDILNYLDTLVPPNRKLYPEISTLRSDIDVLETEFNQQLGTSTRQWGYYYALQNRELMQRMWCDRVPKWQQSLFPAMFPIACFLVNRIYNVNRETSLLAYERVQAIFARVSDRLADGRRYLVGDRFSAADLTFACLAAPAIVPVEYGGLFPELNQLPAEMVAQIQKIRKTLAGEYVLRLYREERYGIKQD